MRELWETVSKALLKSRQATSTALPFSFSLIIGPKLELALRSRALLHISYIAIVEVTVVTMSAALLAHTLSQENGRRLFGQT